MLYEEHVYNRHKDTNIILSEQRTMRTSAAVYMFMCTRYLPAHCNIKLRIVGSSLKKSLQLHADVKSSQIAQ